MPQMGLMHFWQQGDAVTHATAVILLLLSMVSWYVILSKAVAHFRFRRSCERALAGFWNADSQGRAVEAIRAQDKTGILAAVAVSAVLAAQAYAQNAARGIGTGVDANEFVTRALRQRIVVAQAVIERGLTFLASVGATAPFIGLFGTVWGIYHALIGLSGASQVVLEKVAGPVGEALIMTAAGLFVAVPAVLAYNAFVRVNRLVMAQVDGFAHDLHAYLITGIRLHGGDNTIDLAQVRQARGG